MIGFLASSEQTGDTRTCTLEGGGELTEKIVSVDHDFKRVMYAITQSPLNMDFHSASIQVEDLGEKTRMIWIVDLLPETAIGHMEPMVDSACLDMVKTLAG